MIQVFVLVAHMQGGSAFMPAFTSEADCEGARALLSTNLVTESECIDIGKRAGTIQAPSESPIPRVRT